MGPSLSRSIFRAVLQNFVETILGTATGHSLLVLAAQVVFTLPALWFSVLVGRFHQQWAQLGPRLAARDLLLRLYAGVAVSGVGPMAGRGTLVVSNHPGLGDTLALLSTLNHDQVLLVAKMNPFLRPLAALTPSLILVGHPRTGNLGVVGAVLQALAQGKTVVLYPAGAIEPDPAWTTPEQEPLLPWSRSVGTLIRLGGRRRIGFDVQTVAISRVYPWPFRGRGHWDNLGVVLGITARKTRVSVAFGPAKTSESFSGTDEELTAEMTDTMKQLFRGSPRVPETSGPRSDVIARVPDQLAPNASARRDRK